MNWQTLLENWKGKLEDKLFFWRFQFSLEEKANILKVTRQILYRYLNGEASLHSANIPHHDVDAAVDVAYWVDGRLRGSKIVFGKSFGEALTTALMLCARDERFAPLQAEELPRTRIEITILASVLRPLTSSEWEKNEIDPERGYHFRSRNSQGWYLPAVHNVRSFQGLQAMLKELAREKASYQGDIAPSMFWSFPVISMIESIDHERVLELSGPLVKDTSYISSTMLRERLKESALGLMRWQSKDGNIPAVLSVRGEVLREEDPIRQAFSGLALVLLGKTLADDRIFQAGKRAGMYAEKLILENTKSAEKTLLSKAYLGQYFISMVEEKKVQEYFHVIMNTNPASFHVITRLQRLTFLLQASEFCKIDIDTTELQKEIKQLKDEFWAVNKEEATQLATYPELIRVLMLANQLFESEEYFNDANKIISWYLRHQLPDGSFSSRPGSRFAYTRGTGKLLEVLVLKRGLNEPSVQGGLQWLLSLQYNAENTYFLNEAELAKTNGWLRHDAFSRELWSDAIGHFIMAGVRILEKEGR